MGAALQSLPKIVRFISVADGGEGAECPHCGARGRYVHRFELETGVIAGAMSGCVQLFPIAPIALVEQRLALRAQRYAKNGWSVTKADQEIMGIVGTFRAGEVDQSEALRRIANIERRVAMHRRAKGGAR